jgi:hypothetical protein
MSNIDLKPCPVCEKEFDNVTDMIEHVKLHNRRDPEYDKSVVAEEERDRQRHFGG